MSEGVYYEDGDWVKGKYKCNKETPKCAIYPWATKKSGRKKCIPCEHLTFTRHDGTIETFDSLSQTIIDKEEV